MNKITLNSWVYDISVDQSAIAKEEILDMHDCLIKNH